MRSQGRSTPREKKAVVLETKPRASKRPVTIIQATATRLPQADEVHSPPGAVDLGGAEDQEGEDEGQGGQDLIRCLERHAVQERQGGQKKDHHQPVQEPLDQDHQPLVVSENAFPDSRHDGAAFLAKACPASMPEIMKNISSFLSDTSA